MVCMDDAANEDRRMELIWMVETIVPIVIEDAVNCCKELTRKEDILDAATDDTIAVLPTKLDVCNEDTINREEIDKEDAVRDDILVLVTRIEEATKNDPPTELIIIVDP